MASWAPLGTTLYIPQVIDAAICLCPSSLEIQMKSEDQSRTISQGEISENAPKRKRKRPKHPFWDFQPFAIPGCCHGPGSPVPGVYGFHKGFSVHRLTTVVHCPLNGWSFCYICAWHVSKSIFWTRKYYIICLRLSGKISRCLECLSTEFRDLYLRVRRGRKC